MAYIIYVSTLLLLPWDHTIVRMHIYIRTKQRLTINILVMLSKSYDISYINFEIFFIFLTEYFPVGDPLTLLIKKSLNCQPFFFSKKKIFDFSRK